MMAVHQVALCLIARDEAGNIERCLDRVRSVVDEMIVVDTGSTDDTAALARARGARVIPCVWRDSFAEARNLALNATAAEWVIVLDADEMLHPDDAVRLANLVGATDIEGYYFPIFSFVGAGDGPGADYMIDYRLCLFRHRPAYRYRGAIHEEILWSLRERWSAPPITTAPIRIWHYGYLDRYLAQRKKIATQSCAGGE